MLQHFEGREFSLKDAVVNGVSAICYEAVKRLPVDRQPDLRESGDVDFVARTDFEGCNAFIESLGIDVKSQEKHTSFVFKAVHFENHTLEPTGGYNKVHHNTMALLKESLPKSVRRSDGCLELDPAPQAFGNTSDVVRESPESAVKLDPDSVSGSVLPTKQHTSLGGLGISGDSGYGEAA